MAIIGTSGSGKSTMMNILGCLDVPTRGEYLLDGTPIRERTQRELSQIDRDQGRVRLSPHRPHAHGASGG